MKKNIINGPERLLKKIPRSVLSTLVILIFLAAIAGLSGSVWKYKESNYALTLYFEKINNFQNKVIQEVAIYEDYRNSQIESELRTHLLNDHLEVASKGKYTSLQSEKDIVEQSKKGELQKIGSTIDEQFFFYNVKDELRYLRPFTLAGLRRVTDEFQKKLPQGIDGVKVKLAVSSASRPVTVQNLLRSKNGNASFESTHSYGISFDIFYDEFYVSGKLAEQDEKIPGKEWDKIRRQYGMASGAALRRQFQTILSKTLIEMQQRGELFAIIEPNQRCYHVTILPK